MPQIEYDHLSVDQMQRPWPLWERMREQDGLHSPLYGGFHILCRYPDVFAALADPDTFCSSQGVHLPRLTSDIPLVPVESDPPEHRGYRRILNAALAPKRVEAMRPWIEDMAVELIESFAQQSRVEFVSAYAGPLPRRVAYRALGFPPEDFDLVNGWISAILHGGDRESIDAEVTPKLGAYLMDLVARRRALTPGPDDVIQELVDARYEGERALTDTELVSMLTTLLFGGLHTTTSAVSGMVLWLADHPEDRDRLRADPGLHRRAGEEFVRWVSPIPNLVRTATAPSEVGGCPVTAGDKVMIAFGSANHDPQVFDRPDEAMIDRHPNRHVGYGAGPHRCVGAHLATLLMAVTIQQLLARVPDFHIADHSQLQWEVSEATGLTHLPLMLGPRPAPPVPPTTEAD